MKLAFFFLLTLLTFPLFAQQVTYQEFVQMDSVASIYMEEGKYTAGLAIAQQTSQKIAQARGTSDTTYAEALDREGTFHFYLGQFDQAEPLFQKVLSIREAQLKSDHPDIATALSNLSLVYNYQGYTQKAIPLSLRAVEIDRKVYGEQHENYSYSINNLGVLYHSMDEYQKAAECFLISLHIDEKTLGEEHPDYMGALLNLGVVYNGLGDYPEAYRHINKAFRLYKQHLGLKHPQTLRTLTNLADLHNRIGNYDLALKYNKQAVALIHEVMGEKHPQYAIALTNLGNNYGRMGDYENAEKYILQTLSTYEQTLGKKHPNYPSVLSILAHIYTQMQRYQEAENINRQALAAIEKKVGKYSSNYTYALGALGDLYTMTKEDQKALEVHLQTLPITKKIFGARHPNMANIYTKIAISYSALKDYNASIDAYEQALSILEEKFGKQHPRYAYSIAALADVYEEQKDYKKAGDLYQNAFDIMETTYGSDSYLLSNYGISLARFHNRKNPALAHHLVTQSILVNLKTSTDSTQLLSNLKKYALVDNFWNVKDALFSINLLATIQLHLYETTQDIEYKKQVLHTLQALATLSSQAQRNLIQEEDQMAAVKFVNYAAVGGVKASQELYDITKDPVYLDEALKFAENNKSTVLNSTLYQNQALALGGIPDSLIVLEKGIKKRVAELQISLEQAQKDKETNKIPTLQEELVQYTLQQTTLQEQLKKNYPKYNEIRQAITAIDIEQIQAELLEDNSALLEYFIYDTFAYLIVVTPQDAHLVALDDLSSIQKEVKQLRNSLTNYTRLLKNTRVAAMDYVQSATRLYQLLLHPIAPQLKDIQHLTIVADGTLGHIPFEALLTSDWIQEKEVNFQTLPYLLHSYSISYSYSTSLLLQNKANTHHQIPNNGQIIGFAASYPPLDSTSIRLPNRSSTNQRQRSGLQALPAVQKEVQTLESIFDKGAFFYGQDANETNFKKLVEDYAVVHLAMHGILQENQPLLSSLAFTEDFDSIENNFLTAQEISQLNLKSDLVVLSACETGFGKFAEGEGVLSLSRSFMYAGVPSLVVSLWQVNDVSTAFIMKIFYQKLSEGLSKDEALRAAKLSYIQSSATSITAHPAFWSPFIQLGDNKPVAIATKHYWWWILGISSLVILGGLLLWFRRKKA